jgi:hypothetical protein
MLKKCGRAAGAWARAGIGMFARSILVRWSIFYFFWKGGNWGDLSECLRGIPFRWSIFFGGNGTPRRKDAKADAENFMARKLARGGAVGVASAGKVVPAKIMGVFYPMRLREGEIARIF